MTVDQTNKVDVIGVDRVSGKLVISIIDHLGWEDDEHLHLLQEKLNTYLAFIESGELLETYPDADGRSIVIDLICKFPMDESAKQFFEIASSIIGDSGVTLRYKYSESD